MIELTGDSLTIDQLKRICLDHENISIAKKSMKQVQESRRAVDKIVADKKIVYGINTGFGKLSDVMIKKEDVEDLHINLIQYNACGVGESYMEMCVRAMMFYR